MPKQAITSTGQVGKKPGGSARTSVGRGSSTIESLFYTVAMSTTDQTFSSPLHGEALLRAKRPELDPLIAELRELSQDRHDIRTECAGIIAGAWFPRPIIMGEDLIAAGLLINAGPLTWTRSCGGSALDLLAEGVCGSHITLASRTREIRRSLGAPRPNGSFVATPRNRRCLA